MKTGLELVAAYNDAQAALLKGLCLLDYAYCSIATLEECLWLLYRGDLLFSDELENFANGTNFGTDYECREVTRSNGVAVFVENTGSRRACLYFLDESKELIATESDNGELTFTRKVTE